ncbi:MAG: ABC transporter permease [Blastocatellia bacterium]|nr:ABC transporter permease [Blastocatellia bacterium]
MDNFLQDLRYGARALIKNPGFASVAVIALALGIGANTAIFSVVNAVLLRPLPYQNPDQLVMVWETSLARGLERNPASPVNYADWREQKQIFDHIAGWWYPQINLTDDYGEPERVRTIDVTDEFFSVFGVQPLLGRTFLQGEDRRDAEPVVVLSYNLWQRRFGGDASIVGKAIRLDGTPYSVIGIMPAGFSFPEDIEVWRPLGWDPTQHSRNARFFDVVARLKPDVTIERAQAEMTALARRFEKEYPQSNTDWGVTLVGLHDQIVGRVRPALLVLLGAVGFVLLIACANVANLLLVRAGAREKEVAIRMALGAGRFRLIRQFLTESVLLAMLGGALGLALAFLGGRLLMAINPIDIPRADEAGIDLRILGFTLAVSLLTGLIFGIVPALQFSRPDLNSTLKEGGRESRAGSSGRRIRSALVVSEIALALMLLVGAGLLLKSFFRLQGVNPGLNPANVLTLNLQLPFSNYSDWRQVSNFYAQLTDRIEALPGVTSADVTGFLPLESGWRLRFAIPDRPPTPPGEELVAQYHQVSPGYFRTLGIRLLAGRELTDHETADSPGVVIINEAMARRYFPDEDPVGKRLTSSVRSIGPLARYLPATIEYEIVGIAGNVKNDGLGRAVEEAIYFSHRQFPYRSMSLVIRTNASPLSLLGAVRDEIWAMDKALPVSDVKTMEELLADSMAESRFSTLLLGLFAALALVLASVGIYGVLSYSVAQRKHEIGIRMALGAGQGDILKMVVGQGLVLVAIGLVTGAAAAFGVTRLIRTLLYEVSATDTETFVIVSLLLGAVATLASYIPARRATKVDPMVALRCE